MRKESKIKKFAKVLALSLALTLAVQTTAPASNAVTASAAEKVKLSVTKKSLTEGEKFTLKVKGTSKKAKFSSSKKSVATVSTKGVVAAKQKGTASITVSVDGKKYVCKVTVKESAMVAKAPFAAKEVKIESATVVMPKDWEYGKQEAGNITVHAFAPKDADKAGIVLTRIKGDFDNANFDLHMEALKDVITADYMKSVLSTQLEGDFTVEDFSIAESAQKFPQGRVSVISYNIKQDGKTLMTQKIYDLFAEGYVTEFTVVSDGTVTTPNVDEVANYMMKSLTFTK